MPNASRPIDDMIAKTSDWRGETLGRLRAIVLDADPEMTEDVKWRRPSNPMGSAVWEHNGIVCIGILLKERVRLTLNAGASLPDPKGLFNAQLEGKSRAIDYREGDRLNASALKALIRAGVKHNLAKAKAKAKRSGTK
jgi:hypothetical protein